MSNITTETKKPSAASKFNRKNEIKAKERAAASKKKRLTVILVAAAIFVLLVGLFFAIFNDAYLSTNRWRVVYSTPHVKITYPMYAYYFLKCYDLWASEEAQNYTGYDSNKPLNAQKYSETETYFDLVAKRTDENVALILLYAEDAYKAGTKLSAAEKELAEMDFQNLVAQTGGADAYLKRLTDAYGTPVKEKDIKRAIEVMSLAFKRKAEISSSVEISDATLKEAIKTATYENKGNAYICTVDLICFFIDKDKEPNYKELAEELAKQNDKSLFNKWITEYLCKASYGVNVPSDLPDDKQKELSNKVKSYTMEGRSYEQLLMLGATVAEWSLDTARQVGESKVVIDNTGASVIFMIRPLNYLGSLEDGSYQLTRDVETLRFGWPTYSSDSEAKSAANSALTKIKALAGGGPVTASNFAAYARVNSNTPIYKYPSALSTDFGSLQEEEILKWIYNTDRVKGDAGIINPESGVYYVTVYTDDGYHVWERCVRDALQQRQLDLFAADGLNSGIVKCNQKNVSRFGSTFPS